MKENLEYKPLNYNSYLKIPELLNLQSELSDPKHHDEMFFIIIHQAMELWFKQILHETTLFRASLADESVSRALKALKRSTAIMDLLRQQINLLSTLTPVEFAGFRENLRPASGFQSIQYRVLEFTFGVRDEFFLTFFPEESEMRRTLAKLQSEPSVHDDFLAALAKAGFSIPKAVLERDVRVTHTANAEVVATLKSIYENPKSEYHWVLLFEAMLDFDEKFTLWRDTHILMVARTIGAKPGTGGSAGYKFLQQRLHYRFFPELWEVRTLIGPKY
jgi:tryptophan 2,3-dioxygenase